MVNAAQVAAIKASWGGVDLQAAGTAFYCQLASNAPDVYAVFNLGADPKGAKAKGQGMKVMQFVDLAVTNIDDMGTVKAKIEELAQRHTNYGSKKAHFPPAKPCFLAALAEVQGGKFNPDAKAAWGAFYDIIATGLSAHLS